MKGWKIGTIAALGGSTLALAMLIGLAGARADELSDLKANQDLLQQRLDQLSQAPGYPYGTAPPAAGAPVTAGSFPRSFLIPGTDTSLRIGGFAQGSAVYYLNGVDTNGDSFGGSSNSQTCPDGEGANCALPSIPLDLHGQNIAGNIQNYSVQGNGHSRGTYFQVDARLSQFLFDARTPTPWGEAKAFISMDFASTAPGNDTTYSNLTGVSSGWIPRLREAYGSLGGLLIGQTLGPFRDITSEGEFLTSGDEGYAGRARTPQIKYTWSGLPYGMTIAVAAANPVSEGITPLGGYYEDTTDIPTIVGCSSTATAALTTTLSTVACLGSAAAYNPFQDVMPDWSATWRTDQPWGHVQLGGALRENTMNDGKGLNLNTIGGGGYLSGDFRPFYTWQGSSMAKDDLGWGVGYGPGIGSLISDCYAVATNWGVGATAVSSNINGGTTAAGAANSLVVQDNNRALYDAGVKVRNIDCFGAHIDALHWWTDQLRTNLTGGVTYQGVDTALIQGTNCISTVAAGSFANANCGAGGSTSANKYLFLGVANLIWSPVSFVDLGVEYAYGHRVTTGNLRGDANVLSASMKVKF